MGAFQVDLKIIFFGYSKGIRGSTLAAWSRCGFSKECGPACGPACGPGIYDGIDFLTLISWIAAINMRDESVDNSISPITYHLPTWILIPLRWCGKDLFEISWWSDPWVMYDDFTSILQFLSWSWTTCKPFTLQLPGHPDILVVFMRIALFQFYMANT